MKRSPRPRKVSGKLCAVSAERWRGSEAALSDPHHLCSPPSSRMGWGGRVGVVSAGDSRAALGPKQGWKPVPPNLLRGGADRGGAR